MVAPSCDILPVVGHSFSSASHQSRSSLLVLLFVIRRRERRSFCSLSWKVLGPEVAYQSLSEVVTNEAGSSSKSLRVVESSRKDSLFKPSNHSVKPNTKNRTATTSYVVVLSRQEVAFQERLPRQERKTRKETMHKSKCQPPDSACSSFWETKELQQRQDSYRTCQTTGEPATKKTMLQASKSCLQSLTACTTIFLLILGNSTCHAFVRTKCIANQGLGGISSSHHHHHHHMVPQVKPCTVDQTNRNEGTLYDAKEEGRPILVPTTVESFSVFASSPVTVMSDDGSLVSQSSDDASENKKNERSDSYSGNNSDDVRETSDTSTSDAETIRGRQVALYRSGILPKGPQSTKKQGTERKTSVGDRRVGSATQVRRGIRRTTQLVDAVKQRAQGLSGGAKPKPLQKDEGNKAKPKDNETSARLSTSRIHSTVEEMLQTSKNAHKSSQSEKFASAISSWGKSFGILGDEINPPEGEILSESPSLVVRVATPMDDVDIANLRLSVFSDFSPEIRSQFCLRSCQALAHRRTNGAICVVAKPPAHHNRQILLGSAECSFHEFQCTRLGRRRPIGSILYITEVAVHPSVRRRGIGAKLLDAMDAIARQKEVETLYLHVDVSNFGAMGLYEKCGYKRTNEHDPIFQEFTTSLNLHPGATRGRTHYLLYKNLRVPTWLEERSCSDETRVVGSLGFEIPA